MSRTIDSSDTTSLSDLSSAVTGVVRLWLLGLAGLVFGMVLVGGATRLTDSGLSITDWRPLLGVIPPMSQSDWLVVFERYQQIPEYKMVNEGMSLDEFKLIYWWEWGHRLFGRLIGFAFLIPFVIFLLAGYIPRELIPKLIGLFALGAIQGLVGWYMVQSGLVDRVDVSQYRLALHLGLATLIYGLLVWLILDLRPKKLNSLAVSNGLVTSSGGLVILIYGQIILGAFVAGMRAGLSHNTWPLMDGRVLPEGLFAMVPWWRNFFENALTVQFDHRVVAYVILAWVAVQVWWVLAQAKHLRPATRSVIILALAVSGQIVLGIWTLLAQVPLALGLVHQACALVLFTVALWHRHCFVGRPGYCS